MADLGHPIPFVTIDVDQWSLRFETGIAMAFSTRKDQDKSHDSLKLGNGKWPLKRCTFRGALWLSQSLKHFWEQNLLLLLAKEEGWRFTLRGS